MKALLQSGLILIGFHCFQSTCAKVAAVPDFDWDGSTLKTSEIEWSLPGIWEETIIAKSFGESGGNTFTISRLFLDENAKSYSAYLSYNESMAETEDWITRQVDQARRSMVAQEWFEYFTTKRGYSAGVVSQQLHYLPGTHNTYIFIRGTSATNAFACYIALSGMNGQIDMEEVKRFTDDLKFLNIEDDGGTQLPSDLSPFASFFSATDRGDNWFSSTWFGSYWKDPNSNWVYHTIFGWLYIHLIGDGVWMYSENHMEAEAWIWTTEQTFPYLFVVSASSSSIDSGFWILSSFWEQF